MFPNLAKQFGVFTPNTQAAIRAREDRNWLNSEKKWKHRVGKGWAAKKVLGRGGQGIIGLWEYEGKDKSSQAMTQVVVKQACVQVPGSRRGTGLLAEEQFLNIFKYTGSPHILKMYRHLYKETGNNTMDYDHWEVHRIFLEFCPNGDLCDWIEKKGKTKEDVSEEEMWTFFHCLALASLVMDHGSEDINALKWDREVVHLDLKLENIFLGAVLTDDQHRDMPILKMADFGLAIDVPIFQDKDYHDKNGGTGTWQFLLPEQLNSKYKDKKYDRPWNTTPGIKISSGRYGSQSNIWQIGMMMWCLKRNRFYPNWAKMKIFRSKLSNNLKTGGETLGYQEDIDEEETTISNMASLKYSVGLNALINECLSIQSNSRPTPENLVQRTRRGLEAARMALGIVLPPPVVNPPVVNRPEEADPPVENPDALVVDPNTPELGPNTLAIGINALALNSDASAADPNALALATVINPDPAPRPATPVMNPDSMNEDLSSLNLNTNTPAMKSTATPTTPKGQTTNSIHPEPPRTPAAQRDLSQHWLSGEQLTPSQVTGRRSSPLSPSQLLFKGRNRISKNRASPSVLLFQGRKNMGQTAQQASQRSPTGVPKFTPTFQPVSPYNPPPRTPRTPMYQTQAVRPLTPPGIASASTSAPRVLTRNPARAPSQAQAAPRIPTRNPARAPAPNPTPEPAAAGLAGQTLFPGTAITQITCVVEEKRLFGFGGTTKKTYKVTGLHPGYTIIQLKRRLEAMGAAIKVQNMAVYAAHGAREFRNMETLAVIGTTAYLRIEEIMRN